jgi:hypothetical protein
MTCRKCGADLAGASEYCPRCGMRFEPSGARGRTSAGLWIGIGLAVLIGLLAVGGIVAAIAVPALVRARTTGNEVSAIGDVRAVLAAEAVWAASNNGAYDRPACLGDPAMCRAALAGTAPMLPADLASLAVKGPYFRKFVSGEPFADSEIAAQSLSLTSVKTFAYIAVPIPSERARAFCGDSTGRICEMADGSEPATVGGLCGPACVDLK